MLLTTRLSEYPIKHDLQEYQFDRAAPVNPVVKALKFLAPMFPPAKWASRYTRKDAMGDLMAGVTVGLMVVPQSLAYATIAELPYEYGLFSSFMGVFIYCALGTSRDVSVGPTAIISLLVAVEAQVRCVAAVCVRRGVGCDSSTVVQRGTCWCALLAAATHTRPRVPLFRATLLEPQPWHSCLASSKWRWAC